MSILQLLARKSASVVRMSGSRRRLMAEAALVLAGARFALLFIPFRKLAVRLGEGLSPGDAAGPIAEIRNEDGAPLLAREIGWAVRRTARYAPFRAMCLEQALAATWMLRRRGVRGVLHLGVSLGQGEEREMKAHAWFDAAGIPVTGYPVTPDFTEVACFV